MERKAALGTMLILLLASMVTLGLDTLSVNANLVIIREQNDILTTQSLDVVRAPKGYLKGRDALHAMDLKDASWTLRKYWSEVENEYVSRSSLSAREIEIPRSHSVPNYKWDFGGAVEWRDFAYVDEDSAELVIGINESWQSNYYELADYLLENGGDLIDSVSIGGKIQAIVVDVSLSTLDAFVSEVDTAGLASYVEPNIRYQFDSVPNDPEWPKQWGPAKIEADYAWNTTIGDPSVLVAVIDTGIDWNHPDLDANYVSLGYDWVNNDPDPMDDVGHGTHVAGIIAAVINNGIGISGLAQVRIMSEKGLGPEGGRLDDLAKAIVHAVDQGADILNLSWGSYVKSSLLHEAIKYADDRGVLVVAAAGNDATSEKNYPAAYDEVIAVTATDQSDNPASFTNFGDWVEVGAPGVKIYSTVWDDSYVYMSGTSMSSPHVAGVAALIWSQFPSMTRDQVWAQLQYTADDLGEVGFDVYYGYGRVNAGKAVEQAPFDHDVLVLNLKTPSYMRLGKVAAINTTILNMGTSSESNIIVQLLVNGSVVNSTVIGFLISGASTTANFLWNATIEGAYNVTSYVVPMLGETIVGNNALSKQITVRIPRVIRVPDDYDTIQGAIDGADEGDTVYVASGTYYENVWIDKEGLTLVGEDISNTIIDGKSKYDVICVWAVDDVQISRFTIRNSGKDPTYYPPLSGILLYSSKGTTISDTMILNSLMGMGIFYSSDITLRNNNMTGNMYNFGVDGDGLGDFIHSIDASNTVDGKPLYYWVNEHGNQVPSDAGYVATVNSTNIVVKDLNLTKNFEGVLFAYTINSSVENVNVSNNYVGTYLSYSHNNTVHGNIATDNSIGVYLYESRRNNVNDNMLKKNGEGIDLYYSEDNRIAFSKLLNNGLGLYIEKSNNNVINSNEASNGTYGLLLEKSGYNVLRNNNMTSNEYNFGVEGNQISYFIQDVDVSNTVDGKPVYYWLNQDNKEIPADAGYVAVVNSTNITVKGLNLTNNIYGVLLAYTTESLVEKVNAKNNIYGIYLHHSSNNTIVGNAITSKNKRGIQLISSNDNTISSNMITNNYVGIGLWLSAENNAIKENTINGTRQGVGIYLDHSNSNTIDNNTITKNGNGILLDLSGNNILRNNNLTGNSYNFGVYGVSISYYINDVDTSNIVDGKPIYYWVNQHDKQVPTNAGYVAVVNSTSITVKDLNISNNEQGVLLAYTTNSTITNVIASDNYDGISLYYSDGNTIVGNTVTDSAIGMDITVSLNNMIDSNIVLRNIIGIYPYYSDDNIVINNKVSGYEYSLAGIALTEAQNNIVSGNEVACNTFLIGAGIYLEWSSNNNTIFLNTMTNNFYGISLGYWGLYGLKDQNNNNTIYHNNFIKNTQQALSLNSINTWDNGYPSGGNYWSNYNGTDNYSGPYQNLRGYDGIGDTPYIIDSDNKDRYPYMIEIKGPYTLGDLNHDGKVDIDDIMIAAISFGSYPRHPRWNPLADINQDNIIDIDDIVLIAMNFGKTYT